MPPPGIISLCLPANAPGSTCCTTGCSWKRSYRAQGGRPATTAEPVSEGFLRTLVGNFYLRSVLKALFTIFLVTTLSFLLIRMMPMPSSRRADTVGTLT